MRVKVLPPSKDAFSILDSVVCNLSSSLNSPRSLTVYLLWKHKEYEQLVNLSCNSNDYTSVTAFADDYQITELLKKHPSLNTGIDTTAVAKETFLRCEEQCRITNLRLRSGSHSGLAKTILSMARKRIHNVLGEVDSLAISEIFDRAAWGGGSTSASKGKHLSVDNKLRAKPEATADLIAAGVHHLVNSIPAWADYIAHGNSGGPASVTPGCLIAIPGNTVTYVPKNAKTDRPIAVEPHLNALLQKGIGSYMQYLLRKVGINLRDQSVNQTRARLGSLTMNQAVNNVDEFAGKLATLDMKSASDTVSEAIVEELVPSSWLRLYDVARSKLYQMDDKWLKYHKHSSMGNGYTFELETLIFDSIAKAVCEFNEISVKGVTTYGDDLIVPQCIAQQLIEVLNEAGFTTNESKSFITGPFRESCGQDFFDGVPVRPIYVRQDLDSVASIYQLANAIRHRSSLLYDGLVCDIRYRSSWMGLFQSVPRSFRFRCPKGYGDSGFVSNFDESAEAVTSCHKRDWHSGFRSKGIRFRSAMVGKREDRISVVSGLWDMGRACNPDHESLTDARNSVDRTEYSLRSVGAWSVATFVYDDWPHCGVWG